jgi:RNA polymerase sigma-70 factor (ECF subfamily)
VIAGHPTGARAPRCAAGEAGSGLRAVQAAPAGCIVRRVPGPQASRVSLPDERGVCDRARAGDRAALGLILRTYGPILYRAVLLPRLGSEAAAQDALADTYARVVERFDRFEWQDCGVYPWLRVVALRIALDALRGRRRESPFEPEDLEREIDRAAADAEGADVRLLEARDLEAARARVEAALGRINPRYARAIRLRILDERPREEVAAELGVTVATFDVVLHRALTALKKVIGKGDPGAEAST